MLRAGSRSSFARLSRSALDDRVAHTVHRFYSFFRFLGAEFIVLGIQIYSRKALAWHGHLECCSGVSTQRRVSVLLLAGAYSMSVPIHARDKPMYCAKPNMTRCDKRKNADALETRTCAELDTPDRDSRGISAASRTEHVVAPLTTQTGSRENDALDVCNL